MTKNNDKYIIFDAKLDQKYAKKMWNMTKEYKQI